MSAPEIPDGLLDALRLLDPADRGDALVDFLAARDEEWAGMLAFVLDGGVETAQALKSEAAGALARAIRGAASAIEKRRRREHDELAEAARSVCANAGEWWPGGLPASVSRLRAVLVSQGRR